jgi:hypothetical protein
VTLVYNSEGSRPRLYPAVLSGLLTHETPLVRTPEEMETFPKIVRPAARGLQMLKYLALHCVFACSFRLRLRRPSLPRLQSPATTPFYLSG